MNRRAVLKFGATAGVLAGAGTFAGYELPWNNYSTHTNFFIRISESELNKKIESLKAYNSQAHRNYMKEDFIHSLATVRGVQANSAFAEAFEVYRWII